MPDGRGFARAVRKATERSSAISGWRSIQNAHAQGGERGKDGFVRAIEAIGRRTAVWPALETKNALSVLFACSF